MHCPQKINLSTAEIYQQDGDVRWRNSRNTGGLGDGFRSVALEFLTAFDGQTGHAIEVKIIRNNQILQLMKLVRHAFFAVDIATIFKRNLNGLDYFFIRNFCSTWNNL